MTEAKKAAKKTAKAKEAKDGIIQESVEIEDKAAQQDEKVTKLAAKAGKRSPKALKEAEAVEAKEARKASKAIVAEEVSKPSKPPTRPRFERAGKRFRTAYGMVEREKTYSLSEAVELAVKTATTKFDSTVEVHINLGVDPRQADQNVRDTLVLPHGTGKSVRVAVLAEADDIAAAKKAGADLAGNDDLLKQLEKGSVDFDTLIATPTLMPKLGKYARLLGPKGLMPNPKSGTVTADVAKAVQQAKAGRVEYRVDSTGIIHVGAGKASFGASKLTENVRALFASVKTNKPASLKGNYVRSITLATTMGPGIKVQISEL